MEKISIKAYAVKHKLSIFNVVKMTKSGQVPTEIVVENGNPVGQFGYSLGTDKRSEVSE